MLVSVYLPTRNRLALLQRAVASVLAQTHTELELIVADNGSTDGTAPWLEQLAAQDDRVRWLRHTQSLGVPAARNRAIQQARGAWVTGLDDDDRFLPERVARFLAHAARLDAAGTRYSGLFSTERIEAARGSYMVRKPPTVSGESLFHHNQIFARRSTYLEAGLFDEAMPAWQDLFLRMVQRCGPAHLVPHCTYVLADDARPRTASRASTRAVCWRPMRALPPNGRTCPRSTSSVCICNCSHRSTALCSNGPMCGATSPTACARLARAVARRLGFWMRTRSLRSLRMEEVFP